MSAYPWMKTTTRRLTLQYSPNLDYFGPGWYIQAETLDHDLNGWHGDTPIIYKVMCGTLAR